MKFWEAVFEIQENGKKVRRPNWRPHHDAETLYGLYRSCDEFDFRATDWEILEEPKPKVKRWLWYPKQFGMVRVEIEFYSEGEAKKVFGPKFPLVMKLPFSETEFEE